MTPFDFVHDVLPWIMSAITLYMTFLQGKKTWKAWAVGLVNQVLWLWYALSTQTWGFLPLNLGLWYLYVRNLMIWYDDEAQYLLRQQRKVEEDQHDVAQRRFYSQTDELKARK